MSDTPDWTAPASRINPTAHLTQSLSGPSTTLQVDDTSSFRVGDTAACTGQGSSGQVTFTGLAITALTPTTVTFGATIPTPFNMPGDVTVFPTVVVAPPVNVQTIQVAEVSGPYGQTGVQVDGYGWSVWGKFTPTQTPSLSINRGGSIQAKVAHVSCHIFATSTTAQLSDLQLHGSVLGQQSQWLVGAAPSNGAPLPLDLTGLGFRFTANEVVALTLSQALGTGVFCDMTMSGWDS